MNEYEDTLVERYRVAPDFLAALKKCIAAEDAALEAAGLNPEDTGTAIDPASNSPTAQPMPASPAPPESDRPEDNRTALCDIYGRVAFKFYEEKLSGIFYQDALDAIDDPNQLNQINQLFPGHKEGIAQLTTLLKLILQKAYTTSWPSAQAFSDNEREVCLANN